MSIRKIPWRDSKRIKGVVKGKPLNPNAAAASRYYSRLRDLILKMSDITEREIKRQFKKEYAREYFAQDDSIASQARILMNRLQFRFDELFGDKSKMIAEEITDDADSSSSEALRRSLKELSGGITLKTDILTGELNEVLTATIAENVGLIKSIEKQYLSGVHSAVMRSITTGNGLADLVPYLKKHEGITLRRARLIANDQTRKAFSNINRIRMQKLGVKKFEWLHSGGGQKPRPLHKKLSGQIFSFDNPPIIDERTGERGFPGQLINCRCRILPVIDFSGDE